MSFKTKNLLAAPFKTGEPHEAYLYHDVVGHTDTAGDKNYNLSLSKRRAAQVSNLLVDRGVRREHIYTTSHGEENPLVKTKDNVHEPLNRRVEVVVR